MNDPVPTTVALVVMGVSGSGKTTVARMAAGLLKPSAGVVTFEGKDLQGMNKDEFKRYRKAVQIVHQDPYASLNPIRTIYQTLSAPLLKHKIVPNKRAAEERAKELLQMVGLTPPANFLHAYPHHLSGGQRQRVSVARALTLNPRVIVADEAVSMIDVSLRVSILNLLLKLREDLDVTFLFITHDLAIAKYFAWTGHIGVMYLGRLVEYGRTPRVIAEPTHPYTMALLSAIPEPDPDLTRAKKELELRSADIPSLLRLPPGCPFHPRCPLATDRCRQEEPPLYETDQRDHLAACHYWEQMADAEDPTAFFRAESEVVR